MSTLHLSAGSEEPPRADGQARLYSMKFCPFSQRVRLILSLKNIPHDIVNIHLKNKPEWFLKINPQGTVPVFLDVDGKIITSSTDIANYLNDKYPDPPLYNEANKNRDLELLSHYEKIIGIFSKCIHNQDSRPLKEIIDEISDLLVEFEEELKTRGTKFFYGEQPGMLDLLMWPWAEHAKALPLLHKQPATFDKQRFPHIMKWIAAMRSQTFVQENAQPFEKIAKVIEASNSGSVDYDNI